MKVNVKLPQAAGIRRSVEVQHSTRGLGRMLRRGLHGGKNWVLEREEDGGHRSVWGKLFRLGVVLIPVLIVASAVTGGPERGGQSVSVSQSVFMALLVLLVGLGLFSARERRQGREEPWLELPSSDAESDESKGEASDGSAPEEPTRVLENVQVEDSGSAETGETGEDNSENSTETTRIEQPVLQEPVQQAIRPEAETLTVTASEAPTQVLPDPVQQANTEGAKSEEKDHGFEAIASVATLFHEESPHETTPESAFSLLKDDMEPVQQAAVQATPEWAILDVSDITESDEGLIDDEPTTPLRGSVQTALQEGVTARESVQVSLEKEPMQQPLQGVLQVEFAQRGPYPSGPDPVHENWWVVAPDVEPGEHEENEEPAVLGDATPEAPLEHEEPVLAPAPGFGRHPQVVLTFLASQAPKSTFTTEEKDQIRADVVGWLREETTSGHLSRAEASRLLGVDPSTVSRWLSDDPWAS